MQIIPQRITDFNPRSPRGERLGIRSPPRYSGLYFNPRSPRGERLHGRNPFRERIAISIHAPRGGSDRNQQAAQQAFLNISIHAPRGGSDAIHRPTADILYLFQSTLPAGGATKAICTASTTPSYFNPRSPRGERQQRLPKACGKLVQVPVNVKGTVR